MQTATIINRYNAYTMAVRDNERGDTADTTEAWIAWRLFEAACRVAGLTPDQVTRALRR